MDIHLTFPFKFNLVNRRWTVDSLNKAQWKTYLKENKEKDQNWKDSLGHCNFSRAYIALNRDHPQHKSVECLVHTICHELIHAVFYAEGLDNHNEGQVDRFGGFVAQILQTLEFEERVSGRNRS